jgi:phosphopantetheine--protein transferase-like protein
MKRNFPAAADETTETLTRELTWAASLPSGMSAAAMADHTSRADDDLRELLSDDERGTARKLQDPGERRHFIFRRSFQRVFLKAVLGWQGPAGALALVHGLDTPPQCLHAPAYRLSFSTSGTVALACASPNHAVGIDLERIRTVENVAGLSRRFFTGAEADAIASAEPAGQSLLFLKYWTAKEAGLKAMGRGIASGLNTVVLRCDAKTYRVEIDRNTLIQEDPTLAYLDILPGFVVALMHRPVD